MKLYKAVLLVLFIFSINLYSQDYKASLFGIESNGTTLNTTSIQKAIDYIHENGGGRLVFYVGRYLTGTIHLKSNVTIHLEEGAILVGSDNPFDNVTLRCKEEDYRTAIVLDNVHGALFKSLKVEEPGKEKDPVYSYRSTDIEIR